MMATNDVQVMVKVDNHVNFASVMCLQTMESRVDMSGGVKVTQRKSDSQDIRVAGLCSPS